MRRSLRSFIVFAAAVSGVAVAPEAGAKCMRPSAVLAPSWGKVPAQPVLELLLPDWDAQQVGGLPRLVARTPAQAKVTFGVKPDTTAEGLKTFRVEVSGAAAGPLDLDLVDATGATLGSWSLDVDPGWTAPAGSAAPVKVGYVSSKWTCSHTRTANLSFDGAAWAYRVVAAASRQDLAQGKTRSFVVPRSMALFFGRGSSAQLPDVNVELGYANCFGDTVDWTAGLVISVFALSPDGTEQAVTTAPLLIRHP